ncbi:MAG: hypothetical protein JKX76_06320 [Colwellia sp.]|nr:hypothetical protein [Colwellia sp.]
MADDDELLDDTEGSYDASKQEIYIESRELAEKKALEQAQRNLLARKRIDALMEKRRLKELLDDSDDW